jgi:photosynthetic reaction center cytochrome c subunit
VNNVVPPAPPLAPTEGPRAKDVYKNVQVLTDLNAAEFARVMLSITQWVAPPEQSCNYCHVADLSSDERYTKVVARRMLQMVRHINTDWKTHVADTGVTCYTCHRGKVVPENVWFVEPGLSANTGLIADNAGKNKPSLAAGSTALADDPYVNYLLNHDPVRVVSTSALPEENKASIKQTDATYALMISMSQSLGVNCTYCHNSRSFYDWDSSTPKRATAWYGIRLARELNNDYMTPLTSTFPEHRLGVSGDVAKINCATCHQGLFKPLYGESMAKDYPELQGARAAPPADAAAAPKTGGGQ